MILVKRKGAAIEWTHGAIPFARDETHAKVVEMMEKEPREKVLDVPKWVWLLPFVWAIRLCGRLASKKKREAYRWDETTRDEIVLGGNALIIVGEKA